MQITKVLDNLYLGCYLDAQNLNLLKKLNITHILNVAGELKPSFPTSFTYLHIKASDNKHYQLINYFDIMADFIKDAFKKNGNVFVHCKWGISRSPTAIIAYLIKYHKMTVLDAKWLIKSKRDFINPNIGFLDQLGVYAKMNGTSMGVEPIEKKITNFQLPSIDKPYGNFLGDEKNSLRIKKIFTPDKNLNQALSVPKVQSGYIGLSPIPDNKLSSHHWINSNDKGNIFVQKRFNTKSALASKLDSLPLQYKPQYFLIRNQDDKISSLITMQNKSTNISPSKIQKQTSFY